MQCAIIKDNYQNEIDSNYYQELLKSHTPEKALDQLYQAMVYAAVNNGTYVAASRKEARQIKKELSEVFPSVDILKGINIYTVHIPRPEALSAESLEEVNNMEAVINSSAYKQSEQDQSIEKTILVVGNDPEKQGDVSKRFSNTRGKFQFADGKIKITEGKLDELTGRKAQQYTKEDASVVENRVSDPISEKFRKGKSDKAIKEIEKNSEPNRVIGDAAHKIMENSLGFHGSNSSTVQVIATDGTVDSYKEDGYNVGLIRAQNLALQNASKQLLAYIERTQNEINKATGNTAQAQIYLENLVYDSTNDIAGSIDVLVVYSDGSASIYDYKFMAMSTTTVGGTDVLSQDWISHGKETSFNMQLGEYKRILSEHYGLSNFRESRIIPGHIEIDKAAETNNPLEMLNKIVILEPNTPQVMPIPVSGEQSLHKNTQELITTSRARIDELNKEIKDLYKTEDTSGAIQRKRLEVVALKKAVQALLVNDDFLPLLNDLQRVTSELDDSLEDLPREKLNEFSAYLNIYAKIIPNIIGNVKPSEVEKAKSIALSLADYGEQIFEEIKKRATEDAGEEILKPQKELGFITQYFSNLSMFKHPIFKRFRALTKTMFQTVMDKTKTLAEEAEKMRDLAAKWGANNGKSVAEVYQLLLDPESGNLISAFSEEFFEAENEAREAGKVKFFHDNYQYTGKERYEKDFARYKKDLAIFYSEDTKIYKAQVKNWETNNNLKNKDAWISNPLAVYKYATRKKSDKWSNDEFLYMESQPELKQLYEWLVAKNQEFNDSVTERIDDTFVANIQKGFMQSVAADDGIWKAFKDQGTKLHQSILIRQNDVINQGQDKIPLLYYDQFSFKTKDASFKERRASRSDDLIYNTLLFGNQVYLNQERHRIEDRVQGLRILLKNAPALKTDWKGDIDRTSGAPELLESDPRSIAALDAMIRNYVYGQSVQSKDKVFAVGDQLYSTNKILLKLMSYMSLKSLAGNYVSGLGNLGGAYLNSFIKGTGAKYYTTQQLLAAHKMLIRRSHDDGWNRLTEFFNIERDFWAKQQGDKLSASKLTQKLTYDKWYILQQKGDEFVANSILIAMMQNYGIDSNGDIQLMEDLPENSTSLLDRYSIKDDKVHIEGMDTEAFKDFRNRVKYIARSVKGTNTKEDISVIETEVKGRAVMHFRNWIAPMVKERFGNLVYTEEVKQWEVGRYRALFTKMNQNFIKSGTEILKGIVLLRKVGLNSSIAQETVDKYNSENGTDMKVEDYIAAHEQQLQSAVAEFRIIAILLGIMAGMGWEDDEGDKFYSKFTMGRHMLRIMERVHNEMSFFSSPTSVKEILKSPIPVMKVIEDAMAVGINTLDETGDLLFGEDDSPDRANIGKKSGRLFPIVPWAVDVLSDFREED